MLDLDMLDLDMLAKGEHQKVLFFYEGVSYRLRASEAVAAWLLGVAASEGKEVKSLRVIVCSDKYVQKLHARYLGKDSPTDILTFDYSEAGAQALEGELYVGMGVVRRHAKRYGVALEEELFRVLVHGLLHLCGYSDASQEARALMRRQEDTYLLMKGQKICGTGGHVPCET